ncbi:unnamed protein product [Malus baccata var. baccata]
MFCSSTRKTYCELRNLIFACSDQHTFFRKVVPNLVNYNISNFEVHRSSTTPDIQMSESGSLSDEGSPSSGSRFEPAMSGSSWPLLDSWTKETLDDPHNCQTLANIGSSSMLVGEGVVCDAIPICRSDPHNCQPVAEMGSSSILVGEGVVCDAIPIFRSEFTADHLENNLLDSEKQLKALRQSCSILRSVGIRLIFLHAVTRCTIKLCGQELVDVEKVLRVPKEDRHLGKLRPLFRKYGFQPVVSECQRRAMEKVGKKVETSTKKRRVPMLVPSEDILFHKEARKHRVRPIIKTKYREEVLKVAASKKAEVEAIGYAAAIVAGEDKRLLPPLPTINPIFPPVREHIGQEGDPSSSSKGKDKEEVGSVPWKDLKVMAEYHDRLREAERCKVKLKENKQLVNDARKTSKALAEAIQVKDQHFESLKRRNGENLRLKVQLEATKKQLETTMLEVSKVKGELDNALVEVSELKSSIPTEKEATVNEFLGSQAFLHVLRPRCTWEVHFEKRKWMAVLDRYDDGSVLRKYREEIDEHHRKGETFDLAVYSSSADESGDDASVDEQSHQGDDEVGDAENGGRTQSDMIRGSTSEEDD